MSASPEKDKLTCVLAKHNLTCVNNFLYLARDCLFDTLEILLHYRYTSIELRTGIIEYFRKCLEKQDEEAIWSYEHELHEESLKEMHNISNRELYLDKMSKSASTHIPLESRGLWGDIFCIHWLSNWLKIPIRVWSKTNMKIYLHFNSTIARNSIDILFHDEDPLNGHFEPLLYIGGYDPAANINTENSVMLQVAHSPKTNSQTQPKAKCQLVNGQLKQSFHFNKDNKGLSLHVLKHIIRKKFPTQTIRLAYNTVKMKQEVVVENLEDISDIIRFQSLRQLKEHISYMSQREIIHTSCLNKQKKRLSFHALKVIIRKKKETQKMKLVYNTKTMKQELVIENLEPNASTTSKNILGHIKR